ncbi:hypothetical protein REPUB_Repub14bG0093400 [Reevesia pubescens]
MASSRLSRFIMEVAPQQFVTVMRHRTRKMLDTISEEDRDGNDSLSPTSKSSQTSIPVGAMAAAAATTSVATVTANSKVFSQRSVRFSIFNN